MKIRQRNNGDWCMEHNGVEAPYEVFCHQEDKFTVFDLEDDDTPVANLQDAITAERLTLEHYLRTGGQQGAMATSLLHDKPNPRIQRANVLANCIAHQCHDLIPRALFSEFQDRVTGILSQHGVEVITDADRADAGLPPRDGHGMTFEELAAYERRRLELMFPMQKIKITPLQEDQANEA